MIRKMRSLQTFKVHRARATVRRWLQQIELSGLAIALWTGDRVRGMGDRTSKPSCLAKMLNEPKNN
jgi:hypothetical protein